MYMDSRWPSTAIRVLGYLQRESLSEWGKDMIFGFPHELLSSTVEDIKTVTSLREGCNWVTDLACLTSGPQDSESADTLMTHPDPLLTETPWYSREE